MYSNVKDSPTSPLNHASIEKPIEVSQPFNPKDALRALWLWCCPKLMFFIQIFSFGAILIFLPFEFPSFHFETFLKFNNWMSGFRSNYLNMTISSYPSDILIILISFFTIHKWKNLLVKGESKYLTLFAISAAISLLFSVPILSGACYKLFNISLLVCFFNIIHHILSEDREKKIRLIFYCILGMMVFEGAVATFQYFNQSLVGLKMIEPYPLHLNAFTMSSGELWSIDSLFSVKRNLSLIGRAYGTLPHPNVLGCFSFFSSFITFYLFYCSKKISQEILLGLLIFFHCFIICISFSRASIFVFFIMTTLWFVLFYKKIKNHDLKKLKKLLTYVVCSIFVCFLLFYPQFFHRGGIVNYNALAQASDKPRYESIATALTMILHHPFLGVGLENYPNYIAETQTILKYNFQSPFIVVHNIYLLIMAEVGILGGLFYLLFIKSILQKSMKNLDPLVLTLMAIFVGLLLLGCTDFYLWRAPPGRLLFFLAAGLLNACSYKLLIVKS